MPELKKCGLHRLLHEPWNHCGCRANPAKTFSPLLGLLDDHVSPERLYLETKWASLISFELAAHLVKDTLPVAETVNAAGVRNHLAKNAQPSKTVKVWFAYNVKTPGLNCQRPSKRPAATRV
jgi:hypothetical protein